MQVSDGGDAGEEEVRSLNNRVRSGYVRVVCGGCEFELPALMPSGSSRPCTSSSLCSAAAGGRVKALAGHPVGHGRCFVTSHGRKMRGKTTKAEFDASLLARPEKPVTDFDSPRRNSACCQSPLAL